MNTIYSDEDLTIIKQCKSIEELKDKYNVEYLKEIGDLTEVILRSESKIVRLYYDESGSLVTSKVYNISSNIEGFNSIKTGDTLEDVLSIDPIGSYTFLYSGFNEPRISEHFLSDGRVYTISYDANNIIVSIEISD